jgi:acyl-coenzyme A synthetase/AMP-(fatty) acid ligase
MLPFKPDERISKFKRLIAEHIDIDKRDFVLSYRGTTMHNPYMTLAALGIGAHDTVHVSHIGDHRYHRRYHQT